MISQKEALKPSVNFGFVDLNGELGRLYGSICVALEDPCTVITGKRSNRLIVENGDTEKSFEFVKKSSRHGAERLKDFLYGKA